jgi:hypothetical protein
VYHERGNESRLQIDLPLGSYVPEFKHLEVSQQPLPKEVQPAPSTEIRAAATASLEKISGESRGAVLSHARVGSFRVLASAPAFWLLALTVSTVCFGVYTLDKMSAQSVSDQFWNPLLKSPGSVLTVIPTVLHAEGRDSRADSVAFIDSSHGPYSRISVCDAIALARFASLLGRRSKSFDVKEANLTNLVDLHERPSILVGAVNNHWTMRLAEPLRFHFLEEPSSVQIVDSENPKNHNWQVDYTRPYTYSAHDYAIIARYKDATTGGNILIIAGIGAHATQAASEFVVTSNGLDQIRRFVPMGWEKRNLEMIVETDIINGDSGPPYLVAATTW